MTDDQTEECRSVILGASVSAGAIDAGSAQIPLANAALLMSIQITMVVGLGKVFGQHLTDSVAKEFISVAIGSLIGQDASPLLLGWIPTLGNTIDSTTASSITEALGWAVAKRLHKSETKAWQADGLATQRDDSST